MKRLIIVGGKAPDKLDINRNSYSEVIAADSGYDTARKLGIEIDSAVGDFDSTDLRGELIGKGFVPCSHDKDCSDTELAVRSGSGDYDLIGTAYRRILDYCAKEGLDIISDSYEFCINDYITSKNTDEYITKICFYVR